MTCLSSTTMTDHQKLLAMIEDRAEAQAALRMMLNVEVQRRAECGEAACSESAGTQC